MKTVIITVKGEGPVYYMENLTDPENYEMVPVEDQSFNELEEDGWLDCNWLEIPLILDDVKVLQSSDPDNPVWDADDDGAIDITKKKGKYILTSNYFSGVNGLKTPFYYSQRRYCEICEMFTIELQDDEEFDPKKFQLIKSDYELSFLPYAIIPTMAMYDGKVIFNDESDGYDDGGDYGSGIYSEEQPYAPSFKAKEFVKDDSDPDNIVYRFKEE